MESEPRLYCPSFVGVKLDANSPPITTSSLSESPRLIVPPLKVTTPTNSEVPVTFKSPPTFKLFWNVDTPATFTAGKTLSKVKFPAPSVINIPPYEPSTPGSVNVVIPDNEPGACRVKNADPLSEPSTGLIPLPVVVVSLVQYR